MLYKKDTMMEEASKRNEELRVQRKILSDKMEEIRTTNVSCSMISLLVHILAAAIGQPLLVILGFALISVNIFTMPKYCKLAQRIEKIDHEIEINKKALDIASELEIFPEFSPLNGLVALEIREVSNNKTVIRVKKENTSNNNNNSRGR